MTECNVIADTGTAAGGDQTIVKFDPLDGEGVTTCLANAVAEAAEVPITELPPLGEWVDLDAIEQLFAAHDHTQHELSISFEYDGYEIFVSNVGRIVISSDSSLPEA
jgi:hypothetical protein